MYTFSESSFHSGSNPAFEICKKIFFRIFFFEKWMKITFFFIKFNKLRLRWMKSRRGPRMDMLVNLQNLTFGLFYKSHTSAKARILLWPELQSFFGKTSSQNGKRPPHTVKLVKLSIFSSFLHYFFNLQGHFLHNKFRN